MGDTSSNSSAVVVDEGELPAADVATTPMPTPNETALSEGDVSEDALQPHVPLSSTGGWHQGGDKMWGSGAGLESINSGNVGYYDQGMDAAHARCGGAGCALIVNPPGHRTVNTFHIHFVHYASYGSNLKRKLESQVCGKGGWHGAGLPCGVQQSDDRGQHPHCQCYRMASILRRKRHHCGVGLRMQHRASDQGGLQPQVPLSSVRARRA